MTQARGTCSWRFWLAIVLLAAALACGSAQAQTYRTVTEYDSARRPIKVTDPIGNVSHTVYDGNGRVVREAKQAPAGQWLVSCTAYTWTGQKQQVLGPALTASKDVCPSATDLAVPRVDYAYDHADRIDTETARLNPGGGEPDRVTRTIHDAAGQVLQLRRAVGSSLEQAYATYSHTPNGKQQDVVDANGNRARLVWDGYDRQRCWIFPSAAMPTGFNPATPVTALATAGAVGGDCAGTGTGDFERYDYDGYGNRLKLRKRDTREIVYSYDALNRVASKNVPAPAVGTALAYSVFYGYDLRGLQTYARFGGAGGEGLTNVYDRAGRLASSTSNIGGTALALGYLYDKASNRIRLTHPDGQYFTYEWDELHRLTQIAENGSAALVVPTYDSLSRRTALTRGGSTTGYGYDTVGRLSSIAHDLTGSGADLTLGFSHSRAGQLISRTQSNDLYANTAHYDVTRAYARNGLNQYVTAGPATFSHEFNGNLRTDGANTFSYDTENRLTAVSGVYNANLVYDPMGRLHQSSGGSAGTTRFLYDGNALVAEYDGAGNVIRRYVHGSGLDEPLIWYEGSGVTTASRRQLFANHQGSIVAVADASGQIIGVNGYDAWGIANATNFGRFAFTGQIAIPEAGIYHYKARAYSPTLGRFLQTDPVGYKDQVNLYSYVSNDPVGLLDPTGEAHVHYGANSSVTVTWTIAIDSRKATPVGFTADSVAKRLNATFVGPTEVDGVSYNVQSTTVIREFDPDVPSGPGLANIRVDRWQNRINNGFGGRPTAFIGGDANMSDTDHVGHVAHEVGHHGGSGDQYRGGTAADGSEVLVSSPDSSVMKDYGGKANAQTLGEIITSPYNTYSCDPGVKPADSAPKTACQ